ncbi:MAG: hypothetical protein XXXJIFNMEKO3_03128 [Candidatus Erwinia impunctatus]|nr:hypothetical protein XXXJIFNMEKO_03128 [Culicoides impunctatus]
MNLFKPGSPLIFPADDPQLVKALQRETRAYLSAQDDHRYADGWTRAKALLLLLGCVTCYLMSLHQSHIIPFFFCYLAMMFCAMLLTVNVVHEASHNAFLRGKRANVWLNRIVAIPLGMDPDCWRVRHVRFHHSYTNIESYDPDTAENGLLRQTPWQRWRPFMRAQRYYWPLVAALTFPWYIWVADWLDRAGLTPVTRHLAQQGFRGWLPFLCGKGGHILFCLVLPVWLLNTHFTLTDVLVVYLLSQLSVSLVFVMLIIGTHWAKGHVELPPESGKMSRGRLAHVFATSFDWSCGPQWLGYWLGGLNLHLTHHLFPHWNHRHYPARSKIIEKVADEKGVAYQRLSLSDLVTQQQQFLQKMGRQPEDKSTER